MGSRECCCILRYCAVGKIWKLGIVVEYLTAVHIARVCISVLPSDGCFLTSSANCRVTGLEIPREGSISWKLEMERLLCLEEVDSVQAAPKHAFRHETLLNDRRVLCNLLAKEDSYMPSGSYFVFQEEIRPYMRNVLTKWMLDVRGFRY